jgi:hypothetical protein
MLFIRHLSIETNSLQPLNRQNDEQNNHSWLEAERKKKQHSRDKFGEQGNIAEVERSPCEQGEKGMK